MFADAAVGLCDDAAVVEVTKYLMNRFHVNAAPAIIWIMRGAMPFEVQPFLSEGMPFGIANAKSQIPKMKSAICDLKSEISSASEELLLQGRTSNYRVL